LTDACWPLCLFEVAMHHCLLVSFSTFKVQYHSISIFRLLKCPSKVLAVFPRRFWQPSEFHHKASHLLIWQFSDGFVSFSQLATCPIPPQICESLSSHKWAVFGTQLVTKWQEKLAIILLLHHWKLCSHFNHTYQYRLLLFPTFSSRYKLQEQSSIVLASKPEAYFLVLKLRRYSNT
jgi:hypothetical protein